MSLQIRLAAALMLIMAGGCAQLGLKSVPWPTSTVVHDREALRFLRGGPAIEAELGDGISGKDVGADGRLIGLSASGGGARATAFTLGVLAELQTVRTSDGTDLLEALDFISSNSGGSWAVAAYLADRSEAVGGEYRLVDRAPVLASSFVSASSGRVTCWRDALVRVVGAKTMGEIYSGEVGRKLPRAFMNASLLPSHSPFVFSDAFIQHYRVSRFGTCGDQWEPAIDSVSQVSLAFAASASGTVPGFYHAFASTRLCGDGRPEAVPSFCHTSRRGGQLDHLRIADGGLYDNIGYKTAFELMSSFSGTQLRRRALILVNSATSTELESVSSGARKRSFLTTTAANGVFANQDASFERLHGPMFKAVGVDRIVLLDFLSVAGFNIAREEDLRGLGKLVFYAAHNVNCYVDPGYHKAKVRKVPRDADVARSLDDLKRLGGDCLSENFYRTGTLAKTTYGFDRDMFDVLFQLGQLSVRMNRARLLTLLD
ncbi:patatin-like phospholipase family protein [Sphingomonas sp.]|jgi:hypothetical protein|uniref:patatin-like phospholipase family protein n=1 Tax=Sphingomonas sp. TaxID=28214 RepID=UPI002DEB684A|nr:patatin-like phospholipase family protein [Sphingomonas sp.]HEV2567966.1 patatin-like phospholipase family protein [Sphingomonas sp.]